MRIYFDHQVFSLQETGGNSRYHYELMRALALEPGIEMDLVLGMSRNLYPFAALRSATTRVVQLPPPLAPGAYRYALNEAFGNALALGQRTYDVYHPTHHRIMPLVRARRIVATAHDCTVERYPEGFRYADEVRRAKTKLFARSDRIICVSQATQRDLLQFYDVDPAKTRVIHHGFSPLPRNPELGRWLREKELACPYVLYVGKRGLYKNFARFLRAFRVAGLHREFALLAAGGEPWSIDDLRQLSQGETDLVPFVAPSDADLGELYAGAHLFVYPSLWEGFGFPPLEAMDAGCPVATGNRSSIPEVCGDAPFYFDPEDEDSIAETLLRAVSDEAARRQAVKRGREIVAQYSWERCGAATLAVYRDCQ